MNFFRILRFNYSHPYYFLDSYYNKYKGMRRFIDKIFNACGIAKNGHVWASLALKLRQESELVFLVLQEVVVCCHNKNVQL